MSQQKGFTLIELLVAVGIIGILASVSVVSVNSIRQKSRDAKRLSDVKEVQNALEAFLNNAGSYPVVGVAGVTLGADAQKQLCSIDKGFGTAVECAAPASIYMATVNPNPTPNGIDYLYKSTGCAAGPAKPCTGYTVDFKLEANTGSFTAGTYQASPDGIVRTGA